MKGEIKFGIGVVMAAIALIAALFVSFNPNVEAAYNAENSSWDNSTVTVKIGPITMIDVTPEKMDFGTAIPGEIISVYNVTDTTNDLVNLTAFQIENIGSTNISKIWLNVTKPRENPFGTGNASKYNPGNWLAVSIRFYPEGLTVPTQDMSYIHRVEFNTSQEIVYLKKPQNTVSYGRFRVGSNEYFWALTSSDGSCPTTTGSTLTFIIGNYSEPHTQNDTGDIDLTDGDERIITLTLNTDGWFVPATGSSALDFNGANENYMVIVNGSCNEVHFVAWDRDFAESVAKADVSKLPNNASVFDETIAGQPLYPGQSIAMNVQLRIPYGVPTANYMGYMTVVASRV